MSNPLSRMETKTRPATSMLTWSRSFTMFHHMLALVVRTNMNDENIWESLTWLCLYVSLVSDMGPGLLLVEPLDSMTDDDCFHSSRRWRQLQPGLQFRRLRMFLHEADESFN